MKRIVTTTCVFPPQYPSEIVLDRLAAIGYTIYNWVTGTIDYNTAVLYILVLGFPMIRALSAFTKRLKDSQE